MKRLRNSPLHAWGGSSFLSGVAMLACFAALVPLPSLRDGQIIAFLSYYLLAGAAYSIALLRLGRDRMPLVTIWMFGLLFRLVLLATQPTLSDDVYRYIWDGYLTNQGLNPYALPVNAPSLDVYATPLRALVNNDWMASPYLPAGQVLFALIERLAPQSPLAYQVAAVIFDLATGWLVMDLLGRLGMTRRRVLIYLWNPLVIVEFAHGAHVDALMLFLMMASFWLLARANPGEKGENRFLSGSALALAGATLTKAIPALIVPVLARRWGWKRLLAYGLTLLVTSALFAAGAGWGLVGPLDGTGFFGAIRIYQRWWNFNSGIYHWLEVTLAGYPTAGAVPEEIVGEAPILLARWVTSGLIAFSALLAGWLAWRRSSSAERNDHEEMLTLLRLAVLPIGAYLLLNHTLHPWYITLIVPLLPFTLPKGAEGQRRDGNLGAWAYLSIAVAVSYLTYINPDDLREFALVRQVEYLPFYLLLLWGSRDWLSQGFIWISERRTLWGRMKRK